jgi:uncharacterized peroxidase-related enzyme
METKTPTRIQIPLTSEISTESAGILDAVNKQLGSVPNILKLLSTSTPVLKSFLTLQEGLSKTLELKTRNAIALAVSEVNECRYCVSAHSYFATRGANTSDQEISLNREGKSLNAKIAAAAAFAAAVTEQRGRIEDSDLEAVRAAGYSDAQTLEIIALSAQFSYTNFINNVAKIDIDFPEVDAPRSSAPRVTA